MNVRYRVTLEEAERRQLEALVGGGSRAVRKVKRAQILLAAAAGRTDETIARMLQDVLAGFVEENDDAWTDSSALRSVRREA